MDNRIAQLFEQRGQTGKPAKVLSIFFTAGHPQLNDTTAILRQLQAAGADMVEIGIPFSDPVADGPTIQRSSELALKNGMTLKLLLQQLENIRQSVHIPLLLMGYLNPVLQYGMEPFCERVAQIGIDGLILPDLPVEDYLAEYAGLFGRLGLSNIFLATPQTPEKRLRLIDSHGSGFIYAVSASGTTGKTGGFGKEQEAYFERLAAMRLQNPHLVGFGISNAASFSQATRFADGGIVGSAFIKALEAPGHGSLADRVSGFVASIRG